MSDIFCVTDRTLCREDFLLRLEKLAAAHPKGIVLREKDLSAYDYRALAQRAISLCARYDTPLILHGNVQTAAALGHGAVHLPLPLLRTVPRTFSVPVLGTSCHSVREAVEAEERGCTYLFVGHIFETDCKKGIPPRGTALLGAVCDAVRIPVYAIGGIRPHNYAAVRQAGAAGACVMHSAMQCTDVRALLAQFGGG